MLNLPVYLRGNTYYLHTRVYGKQVKKSLRTSDKKAAMILASQYLSALVPMIIKKFEINLREGILKADGPEDHARMMEALDKLGQITHTPPSPLKGEPSRRSVLRIPEVVEKFFQLKKQLKPATALAYKNIVNEFAGFIGNPEIDQIDESDVTRYMDHLAKFSTTRTIDNKVGVLNTVFNFAIKQGYYFKSNPASNRKLMTKKQKEKDGWGIFTEEEIKKVFAPEHLKEWKGKDPDFYFVTIISLLTGCRISEITGITKSQVRETPVPHINITDSKTAAGIRTVPLLPEIFEELMEFAKNKTAKQQVFKYQIRLGKGSGNAAGQKFSRHLDKLEIENDKLVFHSLRKFFNDYSGKKAKVPLEIRCQMVGHEFGNINVTTYSREYEVTELAEIFTPVQRQILQLIEK